ncbi:hypothetical protein, partial [Candidatus Ichthyocystis sparus]|uniref:hypothetical protein n=1 Tax=Candidatus Ichthyocystis sparus TaxID=1561004 RepID=UPI00159EE194
SAPRTSASPRWRSTRASPSPSSLDVPNPAAGPAKSTTSDTRKAGQLRPAERRQVGVFSFKLLLLVQCIPP